MTRRTPALTRQAQDMYEQAFNTGIVWHQTIEGIAMYTGLTPDQVRDAVFGERADKWRQEMYARRQAKERNDAIHQR